MTTICRKQLLAILRYLNAPSNTYDLGTNIRADVCYDIEHTERGWETFLIERTSRFKVAVFDTETDACLHMLYGIVHWRKNFIQTPINFRQIHSILVYLKVPEALYDFSDAHKENAYFIECTENGWEVFRTQNGERHSVAVFRNPTDACLDLLYRVIHL